MKAAEDPLGLALLFSVDGVPVPQGSLKHIGNGRMISDNPKLDAWRGEIRHAAIKASGQVQWSAGQPVAVDLAFEMPRPKSHYGTGRNAGAIKARYADALPSVYPDVDKLCRAVLDAITCSKVCRPGFRDGLIRDDGQVVKLSAVKRYATTTSPGLEVAIRPLDQNIAQEQDGEHLGATHSP